MGSKARSTPASFLHENNRADGKVKRRTAAKLSDWPVERIETLRALRRGDKLVRGAGRGIVQRDGSGRNGASLRRSRGGPIGGWRGLGVRR
jgi:hypothetical protein